MTGIPNGSISKNYPKFCKVEIFNIVDVSRTIYIWVGCKTETFEREQKFGEVANKRKVLHPTGEAEWGLFLRLLIGVHFAETQI